MFRQNIFSLCAATVTVLTVGAVFSMPILAADGAVAKIDPAAAHVALAAHQAQAVRARQHALIKSPVAAASGKPGTAIAVAKDIFANPSRAYPPSCLADGLPIFTTGADPNVQQATLTLVGADSSGNAISETDTFTVWRVPCSGNVSATLLEIDRDPSASAGSYVSFPNITLTSSESGTNAYFPRLPNDPNTVYSDTLPLGAMFSGNVYVLDYVLGDVASTNGIPDFNQGFSLNIDNLASPDSNVNLNVPTYDPTTFNYPSATNPLEISGYVSGPWYDPSHSGEGMLIQVYDAGDQTNRIFAATWYTFDSLGVPYWLTAQTTFPIFPTSTTFTNQLTNVPTYFLTGGSFAGGSSNGTLQTWGTMGFSFSDCGTLNFTFNSTTTSSGVPTGSGSRTWTRLANVNGLVCE